ncbi:MAG: NUDIX domain-containing protein [Nanoarchaeota archaeon]|nr:NUDIX domain-containing protein [Nanoarchaeota archaeon]
MSVNKLSPEEFIESFKKVPRTAVSMAIINEKNGILLTKRKEDPFKDFWHLPGSFIIKQESIDNCIKRILEEELGFKNNFSSELAFISEDLVLDPRGHAIDLIYKVKINSDASLIPIGRTKELEYFDKIPENVGFNHTDVLKKLGYTL